MQIFLYQESDQNALWEYPLKRENLVFVESVNGIIMQMSKDKEVRIISDGALLFVTTEEHIREYPELEF